MVIMKCIIVAEHFEQGRPSPRGQRSNCGCLMKRCRRRIRTSQNTLAEGSSQSAIGHPSTDTDSTSALCSGTHLYRHSSNLIPSPRPGAGFAMPALKRSHSSSEGEEDISTSNPIHDRSSTFTALFSPSLPPRDLQSHPSISSASHKILAWRLPSTSPESSSSAKKPRQTTLTPGGGALKTGKDDDGEQYAAKHVLRVLEEADIQGSLVVARWYGGVLLGPVRFTHIYNSARDAVDIYRRDISIAKQETREKEDMIFELKGRDENIVALRTLLESKKGLLAGLEGDTPQEKEVRSPARKVEYEGMTLERLRMLDKARDGTVGFLLKQIDAVEEKIRSWEDLFDNKDEEDGEEGVGDEAQDGERNGES